MDGTTPYVAYSDFLAGGGIYKVSVLKYNGSAWTVVGTNQFSAGQANYISMTMNGSTPYVAYEDVGSGTKMSVMKFDGSSWVNVGSPGFSAGGAWTTAIAMNGSNPVVTYVDKANSDIAAVKEFDGTNWVNVGTGTASTGGSLWNSIAIAPNGVPVVTFKDVANGGKLTAMQFTASSGSPLPVELISFTASAHERSVTLHWNTATEVNNHGFEIERFQNSDWNTMGFVGGAGTSSAPKSYSYVDQSVNGTVTYRLKQIDKDGKFKYSQEVEVLLANAPQEFGLEQNFPNPFNPTTAISFHLSSNGMTTLKVYDMIGREVASLVNEVKTAGSYAVNFDASKLASGIYFSKLQSGEKIQIKKMMLIK